MAMYGGGFGFAVPDLSALLAVAARVEVKEGSEEPEPRGYPDHDHDGEADGRPCCSCGARWEDARALARAVRALVGVAEALHAAKSALDAAALGDWLPQGRRELVDLARLDVDEALAALDAAESGLALPS